MKLNLGSGTDIRQDMTNIDILPAEQLGINTPELFRQGDASNLDFVTGDDTVDEILALDLLQCLPIAAVGTTLRGWAAKLKKGGVLKISVPDAFGLAEAYAANRISLSEFASRIFGDQKHEVDFSKSPMDCPTLTALLEHEGVGLTVVSKRIEGATLHMEAEKRGDDAEDAV